MSSTIGQERASSQGASSSAASRGRENLAFKVEALTIEITGNDDEPTVNDSISREEQEANAIEEKVKNLSITEQNKLVNLLSPRSFVPSDNSEVNTSDVSESVGNQLRLLRRRFSSRTEAIKERTKQLPTPSTSEDEEKSQGRTSTVADDSDTDKGRPNRLRLDSVISTADNNKEAEGKFVTLCGQQIRLPKCFGAKVFSATFDPRRQYLRCMLYILPSDKWYLVWLAVLTFAVAYNYFSIPLRECFVIYFSRDNWALWLFFDYLADTLYLMDILLFKNRVQFVNRGIVETDLRTCAKFYVKKWDFKMDVLSLLPLDLFYFVLGDVRPILRLPRLLKIKSFGELFDRLDQVMKKGAHVIRVFRTMCYMIFLIHLEACIFYVVSKYQGFGSDTWVYNDAKNVSAYIACFYLALKTATSIGNNPTPTNNLEIIFMTCYWLSGVFVFAVLIGQIRDIMQSANMNETNYRSSMDTTVLYMKGLNLPDSIINKVRTWFNYNWELQKTLNENSLLEGLPMKLMTDLLINVHFHTLSKVSLFQDCDRTLLYDLILKLKPVLYLPGDYICKKGEIGTEMYIVMNGVVEVVGGPNNSIVFATLKEGSVFGEISLLALSGGNRRTADVRSKGFSTLFTLSKQDFEMAMEDYPSAYELLKKRSKKTLKKRTEAAEEKKNEVEPIIVPREPTPKLVGAVLSILKAQTSVDSTASPKQNNPNTLQFHENIISFSGDEADDEYEDAISTFSEESLLMSESDGTSTRDIDETPKPSLGVAHWKFPEAIVRCHIIEPEEKVQIHSLRTSTSSGSTRHAGQLTAVESLEEGREDPQGQDTFSTSVRGVGIVSSLTTQISYVSEMKPIQPLPQPPHIHVSPFMSSQPLPARPGPRDAARLAGSVSPSESVPHPNRTDTTIC